MVPALKSVPPRPCHLSEMWQRASIPSSFLSESWLALHAICELPLVAEANEPLGCESLAK